MLAGRVSRAGAAARADLAGFPPGAPVGRAARRHPQHHAGAEPSTRPRRACRRSAATSRSSMLTFRYRIDGPEVLHDVSLERAGRPGRRHRRRLGLGQEHARQADPAPLRAGKRPRAGRRRRSRDGRYRPGCAARSASSCRTTSCSTARCARTSRWPIRRCRWSGSSRRHARRRPRVHPRAARRATTPSSASAAAACRAGSASASPSPARWLTDPRILIFDEATSALGLRKRAGHPAEHGADRQGPDRLHHRPPPRRRCARRTASSPSTAGRVVEDGTHDELIRTGGRYATLFRLQGGLAWRPLESRRLPAEGRQTAPGMSSLSCRRRSEVVETPPSPVGRGIARPRSPCSSAWPWPGRAGARSTSSPPRQGRIIPSGNIKPIQPFETGVIRSIDVKDGQRVKAGDIPDQARSDDERRRAQPSARLTWSATQLELERLRAALVDNVAIR